MSELSSNPQRWDTHEMEIRNSKLENWENKIPTAAFGSSESQLLVHQTESTRVIPTEKEMQVRILAGIPFRPTMLPVRPSVIAGILAKDGNGRRRARRVSRIKNELRAALHTGRSILHYDFLLLFRGAHLTTGLETK